MTKYSLNVGGEPIEFESDSPEGFLDAWKKLYFMADREPGAWLRTAASAACDWSGKPMRCDSVSHLTADMISAGMLEEVSDVQG